MEVILATKDYHPSISDIANEIWSMDCEQQLELLRILANIDEQYKICMQLQDMMDMKHEVPDIYKDVDSFILLLAEYLSDYRK